MRFVSASFKMYKTDILRIMRLIEKRIEQDAIENVGPRGYYTITIERVDK